MNIGDHQFCMAVENVTFSEGISENHTTNVVFSEARRRSIKTACRGRLAATGVSASITRTIVTRGA